MAGCSSLGYYWQGFKGQAAILQAAQPISSWLEHDDLKPSLRLRLETAQKMREFASSELGLPRNASYTRYADLQRRFAVWNVTAAPPYSLELHRWCFPVTGCVGYRGYFSMEAAEAQARQLQQQGLETSVYGVPAYSTLGYLNWLGGDPLLSTFAGWAEGDFAGLLFHELAHQVVYVADDTAFNESFATTVERLGTPLWLQAHANAATRERWQKSLARREQWRAVTRETRGRLEALYSQQPEQNQAQNQDAPASAAIKSEIFADFRARYAQLRAQWLAQDEPLLTTPELRAQYQERLGQTDDWVAQANNASFGALAAYDDWVPAFTALWEEVRQQASSQGLAPPAGWQLFYARVREWAGLPPTERLQRLCRYLPAGSPRPASCLKG
ncbi:hypothetical protein GCM10010975_22350 [Comamonas phosphati]|nr:hypothetical protein GCM10010975_22350 [Comamonas phosphati]